MPKIELSQTDKCSAKIFSPFSMRNKNLINFQQETPSHRLNNYKNLVNKVNLGINNSGIKSLDILRATLQDYLNEEIDQILKKYLNEYFLPAVENIKKNNGDNCISEYHIQAVFRQVLDEAKKMYMINSSLSKKDLKLNSKSRKNRLNSQSKIDNENNFNVVNSRKLSCKRLSTSELEKKKILINESREMRKNMLKKRKLNATGYVGRGRPPLNKTIKTIELGEDNWNPDRINSETKFVLGSKANKALGFGLSRGRLYSKHTDLFRYIGDLEDKQWLHEHGLFPISGARAYILIKKDIEKILNSEEYFNAPGVNAKEMGDGFTLPDYMINKMKKHMKKQQNLNKTNNLDNKSSIDDNKNQKDLDTSFDSN